MQYNTIYIAALTAVSPQRQIADTGWCRRAVPHGGRWRAHLRLKELYLNIRRGQEQD